MDFNFKKFRLFSLHKLIVGGVMIYHSDVVRSEIFQVDFDQIISPDFVMSSNSNLELICFDILYLYLYISI